MTQPSDLTAALSGIDYFLATLAQQRLWTLGYGEEPDIDGLYQPINAKFFLWDGQILTYPQFFVSRPAGPLPAETSVVAPGTIDLGLPALGPAWLYLTVSTIVTPSVTNSPLPPTQNRLLLAFRPQDSTTLFWGPAGGAGVLPGEKFDVDGLSLSTNTYLGASNPRVPPFSAWFAGAGDASVTEKFGAQDALTKNLYDRTNYELFDATTDGASISVELLATDRVELLAPATPTTFTHLQTLAGITFALDPLVGVYYYDEAGGVWSLFGGGGGCAIAPLNEGLGVLRTTGVVDVIDPLSLSISQTYLPITTRGLSLPLYSGPRISGQSGGHADFGYQTPFVTLFTLNDGTGVGFSVATLSLFATPRFYDAVDLGEGAAGFWGQHPEDEGQNVLYAAETLTTSTGHNGAGLKITGLGLPGGEVYDLEVTPEHLVDVGGIDWQRVEIREWDLDEHSGAFLAVGYSTDTFQWVILRGAKGPARLEFVGTLLDLTADPTFTLQSWVIDRVNSLIYALGVTSAGAAAVIAYDVLTRTRTPWTFTDGTVAQQTLGALGTSGTYLLLAFDTTVVLYRRSGALWLSLGSLPGPWTLGDGQGVVGPGNVVFLLNDSSRSGGLPRAFAYDGASFTSVTMSSTGGDMVTFPLTYLPVVASYYKPLGACYSSVQQAYTFINQSTAANSTPASLLRVIMWFPGGGPLAWMFFTVGPGGLLTPDPTYYPGWEHANRGQFVAKVSGVVGIGGAPSTERTIFVPGPDLGRLYYWDTMTLPDGSTTLVGSGAISSPTFRRPFPTTKTTPALLAPGTSRGTLSLLQYSSTGASDPILWAQIGGQTGTKTASLAAERWNPIMSPQAEDPRVHLVASRRSDATIQLLVYDQTQQTLPLYSYTLDFVYEAQSAWNGRAVGVGCLYGWVVLVQESLIRRVKFILYSPDTLTTTIYDLGVFTNAPTEKKSISVAFNPVLSVWQVFICTNLTLGVLNYRSMPEAGGVWSLVETPAPGAGECTRVSTPLVRDDGYVFLATETYLGGAAGVKIWARSPAGAWANTYTSVADEWRDVDLTGTLSTSGLSLAYLVGGRRASYSTSNSLNAWTPLTLDASFPTRTLAGSISGTTPLELWVDPIFGGLVAAGAYDAGDTTTKRLYFWRFDSPSRPPIVSLYATEGGVGPADPVAGTEIVTSGLRFLAGGGLLVKERRNAGLTEQTAWTLLESNNQWQATGESYLGTGRGVSGTDGKEVFRENFARGSGQDLIRRWTVDLQGILGGLDTSNPLSHLPLALLGDDGEYLGIPWSEAGTGPMGSILFSGTPWAPIGDAAFASTGLPPLVSRPWPSILGTFGGLYWGERFGLKPSPSGTYSGEFGEAADVGWGRAGVLKILGAEVLRLKNLQLSFSQGLLPIPNTDLPLEGALPGSPLYVKLPTPGTPLLDPSGVLSAWVSLDAPVDGPFLVLGEVRGDGVYLRMPTRGGPQVKKLGRAYSNPLWNSPAYLELGQILGVVKYRWPSDFLAPSHRGLQVTPVGATEVGITDATSLRGLQAVTLNSGDVLALRSDLPGLRTELLLRLPLGLQALTGARSYEGDSSLIILAAYYGGSSLISFSEVL